MIPVEELVRLATLYDRFANHLDPLSADWKERRKNYLEALADLHQRFGVGIDYQTFRQEAQRTCFRWLRAQDKTSTPPPQA
jgi:hypothetical protein